MGKLNPKDHAAAAPLSDIYAEDDRGDRARTLSGTQFGPRSGGRVSSQELRRV